MKKQKTMANAIASPVLQEPDDKWVYSNEARQWPEPPPEPEPCPYCGKLRYHKGRKYKTGYILWIPYLISCDCPGAKEAAAKEAAEKAAKNEREALAQLALEFREKVKRLQGDSGMNDRFLEKTFENFQTPDEQTTKVKEVAERYVQNFEDMDRKKKGLFIIGDIGVGKTHLSAAIANCLIKNCKPVICMTMIDMLARIKATYDKREISEGEILRIYETVPLLVIDDMGKEPATEWGVSKIYAIINARYEDYKPIIVTSNYTDTELERRLTPPGGDDTTARAIVDRLREMCEALVMEGQSWRGR